MRVGGTARLLVHRGSRASPCSSTATGRACSSIAAGSPAGTGVVELPVTEADRGGFVVVLATARDYQLLQIDRRSGTVGRRELNVSFATFRDRLRPGTTRPGASPSRTAGKREAGAAEVLAYMYDRSLDVFAPHHPPARSPLPVARDRADLRASLGQASRGGARAASVAAGLPALTATA